MVALQERNFSPSSDLYKGHKVVAMPSSEGGEEPLSVRNMVTNRTVFDPNRPRSKSAGRATTRSRDIVQEVYDRMGVNRGAEALFDDDPFKINEQQEQRPTTPGRGRGGDRSPESADKFSQRYRAAAALSSPRASNDRGRGAEQQDGGSDRRCRSLSRGRAVAGRWPPAQNNSEQQTLPQPIAPFLPRKTEESTAAAAAAPVSPISSRRHTYSRSESQEETNTESDPGSPKEETTTAASVPSIKDRINVYAGRNSSRNFPQKKPFNYQTYASQKRPAPIDIYQDARNRESPSKVEESASDETPPPPPPEPSAVPPSPAAAAAADAAFAYVRGGNSSRSVKSAGPLRTTPRGSTNGIAGTYLGAIKSPNSSTNKPSQPQKTSAPLSEISAADPSGDGHSVAASSVSADEFNFSSPVMSRSVGGASTKKPSWAERNKPQVSPTARNTNGASQYNSNSTPSNNSASKQQPSTPSAAEIDKMIEQRVKSRVSVVEMRMEEQMLRLERRVEEKLNARIGMLDEKIDKMNSMLAMLLSRELSASDDNERREHEI